MYLACYTKARIQTLEQYSVVDSVESQQGDMLLIHVHHDVMFHTRASYVCHDD